MALFKNASIVFFIIKKVQTINDYLKNDKTNSWKKSSISELENFVNDVIIIMMVCDPG